MKNSKKGISLIVLVITIIVIIILAAAVLLTMSKNNPIDNANKAVNSQDLASAQDAVTMWLASVMASQQNSVTFNGTIGEDAPGFALFTIGASPTAATENDFTTEAKTAISNGTLSGLSLGKSITSVKVVNNKVTEIVKNGATVSE